jgi:hypothetical protein
MPEITDLIPGEIISIATRTNEQGLHTHTVRFTDDTTGEDTTGVWQETECDYTTGWGYNEKTSITIEIIRVS